jgi:hypothetical protein
MFNDELCPKYLLFNSVMMISRIAELQTDSFSQKLDRISGFYFIILLDSLSVVSRGNLNPKSRLLAKLNDSISDAFQVVKFSFIFCLL